MVVAGVFSVAAVVLLWYLFDVLLLLFAAVLLAVVIRTPSDWLAQRTGLSDAWALALTLAGITALLAGAGWMFGSAVWRQTDALFEQLPQALEQLRTTLQERGWLDENAEPQAMLEGREGAFVGRGLRAISATFGALANVVLVLFMAVLLAIQPRMYVNGAVQLMPPHRRERTREVLEQVGHTLRRWLMGQLLLMALVGVSTTVGLWLLDVRYALALGLLAGLLTFIPFIGPLLAAALAILVSLADGFMNAVYVALLYLGVQAMEGVLEPIVQLRAVYLPPVLLLLSQIVLGVLVGALGVILATPVAAALMVAVQMLYLQDVLGEQIEPGQAPARRRRRAR